MCININLFALCGTTNKKPTIQEETRVEETPPVQEPVEEAPVQNEVVANSVLANFVTENILVLGQEKGNTISNELEMPTFAEKQDAENYTWLIIAVVSIIGVLGIGVAIYCICRYGRCILIGSFFSIILSAISRVLTIVVANVL